MSSTFCPLIWKEVAISPSGTVRLCCSSVSGVNTATHPDGRPMRVADGLERAWNSPLFTETREKMKKGEWAAPCETCRTHEQAGLESPRQVWVSRFPELQAQQMPTTVSLESVTQIDLRLGNRCNLKCRMCGPYSSSAWVPAWNSLAPWVEPLESKEIQRLSRMDWYENPQVWAELMPIIPRLERVYFMGGEPFLAAAHKKFSEIMSGSGKRGEH